MKTAIRFLWCLALTLGSTATAAAVTNVTFERPESYTDAALRGDLGVDPNGFALREIASTMRRLGDRYLAPGQVLTIRVLDVDLAGDLEPVRSASGLRIMREGTWPRIKVRYTIARSGRTVQQGEETIAAMDYLMTAGGRLSTDPLRFEKAMLTDWFRAPFGGLRRSP